MPNPTKCQKNGRSSRSQNATIPGITGNVDQNRFNSATAATLSNLHLPIGVINAVTPDGTGRIAVRGWTIDPDTATTPTQVAVTVDGSRTYQSRSAPLSGTFAWSVP